MASDPSQLINYLATSGGGIGSAFTQGQQQALQQQVGQQQALAGMAKLQQSMSQWRNDQQWATDAAQYSANPNVDTLAMLAMKHPDKAEMLQQFWKLKSDEQQRSDLTHFGFVYNLINNGKSDLALKTVQDMRDATKKAGGDTGELDDILDALNSGGADGMKFVKGVALAHLAASGKGELAAQFDKAMGKVDPYTLGPGDTRYGSDNQPIAVGAPKQMEPFHYTLKDGAGQEHEYIYSPDGGGVAAPPGGGGAAPGGSAPLSTRLNNPGAIRFDPKNNWQGQVGQQGGFVQFDSPANGDRAHKLLIANQIKAGFDTPLTWAQHYAPASDGNDPQAYATTIAKGLGIGLGDKIPLGAVPKMASLSAQVEAGGTPTRGMSAPPSNGVLPGSRQIDPLPVTNTPLADAPGDLTKGGDAYLSTLPAGIRGTVKGIATGQMPLPSSFAQTKPYWQQVMAAVTQYDPTFESSRQPERVAAAKAFTGNGKAAQALASIDRFAYHLNDLYRDSQSLTGWNLGPASGMFNAGAQSFQKASVARYNAALPFIAGELQKLTKNGSATEGESKQIMTNLSPTQPASARLAAMQQLAELAQGQFKPIRDQWASAFQDRPIPMDISPEANTILDSVSGDKGPVAIDPHTGKLAQPARQGGATTQAAIPAQAAAYLKANPGLAAQFDQKYGFGASAKVLGR